MQVARGMEKGFLKLVGERKQGPTTCMDPCSPTGPKLVFQCSVAQDLDVLFRNYIVLLFLLDLCIYLSSFPFINPF